MTDRLVAGYAPDVEPWSLPDPVQQARDGRAHPAGLAATLAVLGQRSWLWRGHANVGGKARLLLRVAILRCTLPRVLRDFTEQTASPRAAVRAAYVAGSFAWVRWPNDLDVAVILEGAQGWGRTEVRPCRHLRLLFPSVQTVSIEYVGLRCLQDAVMGADVPKGVVIRRKALVYWGAIYLGGQDVFQGTRPPVENFRVMARDLLTDAERRPWSAGVRQSATRMARKQRWRQAEVQALTDWIAQDG